jgi:hypothetical protein
MPAARRIRRTASSGPVSRDFTRRMTALRFSGVKTSVLTASPLIRLA